MLRLCKVQCGTRNDSIAAHAQVNERMSMLGARAEQCKFLNFLAANGSQHVVDMKF